MEPTTSIQELEAERALLLRYCARYIGDQHAAEDLVQQTLLQAWQQQHQLRDPLARRGWLLAIARNQCLMWLRSHNRELGRYVELGGASQGAGELLADGRDLELEFERDELARLVERALALLTPDVRDVLLRRYIANEPQAEVAARLRTTEGAVEARLQRGKRALRQVLTTELGAEAAAHGLIPVADAGWQETRIWCPNCGRGLLEGWLRPAEGKLYLRCRGCSDGDTHYIHSQLGPSMGQVRSYRPAAGRVLDSIHELFRLLGGDGSAPCPRCGRRLPLLRGEPPWVPQRHANAESIYIWCERCSIGDSETWHSLTWSLPEVRAFWREHPRMRYIGPREIEVAGSAAVVTGFENVSGSARIDVVALNDTLEVVSINCTPPARTTT